MTFDFINVGYGDAILIRDGSFAMLVDCGDETVGASCASGRRVMAADYLRGEGVRTLDLLVLTHLHLDHSGGLTRLLDDGVAVRALWTNTLPDPRHWGRALALPDGYSPGAKCLLRSMNVFLAALPRLRAQGTRLRCLTSSGLREALTDALSVELHTEAEPLHRRQADIWARALDGVATCGELDELDGFINNTSLRLRLNARGQSVQLPGDVYAWCWDKHALPPCDLVKLPHHGHRDALTPDLLAMLAPKHAVISVSDSRRDDCPSADVLRMLQDARVAVSATDAVPLYGARAYHEAVRFTVTEEGELARTFVRRP